MDTYTSLDISGYDDGSYGLSSITIMKVTTSSVQLLPVSNNPLRDIERIARVCTASENKITNDSYKEFIPRLIKQRHLSILRHRRVAIRFNSNFWQNSPLILDCRNEHRAMFVNGVIHLTDSAKYLTMYSHVYGIVIEGNLQAWWDFIEDSSAPMDRVGRLRRIIQAACYERLCQAFPLVFDQAQPDRSIDPPWQYVSILSNEYVPYATVHMITDRGQTHEWVRHTLAVTQSSTRYIKEANDVTFIDPSAVFNWNQEQRVWWLNGCKTSEKMYHGMLGVDCKAQEARGNLNHFTMAQIYLTGTIKQWRYVLSLRDSSAAHPQAQHLAHQIKGLLDIR